MSKWTYPKHFEIQEWSRDLDTYIIQVWYRYIKKTVTCIEDVTDRLTNGQTNHQTNIRAKFQRSNKPSNKHTCQNVHLASNKRTNYQMNFLAKIKHFGSNTWKGNQGMCTCGILLTHCDDDSDDNGNDKDFIWTHTTYIFDYLCLFIQHLLIF